MAMLSLKYRRKKKSTLLYMLKEGGALHGMDRVCGGPGIEGTGTSSTNYGDMLHDLGRRTDHGPTARGVS